MPQYPNISTLIFRLVRVAFDEQFGRNIQRLDERVEDVAFGICDENLDAAVELPTFRTVFAVFHVFGNRRLHTVARRLDATRQNAAILQINFRTT